jgi:hypothetical protein
VISPALTLHPKHQAFGVEGFIGVGEGPVIWTHLNAAVLDQSAADAAGAKTLGKKNVLQWRHLADIVARFVAQPIYR